MPKPTIAEMRAVASDLDAQHPDDTPEVIADALAAWDEAVGEPLTEWQHRAVVREIGIVRRQHARA